MRSTAHRLVTIVAVVDEVDVVTNPKAYEQAKLIPSPINGLMPSMAVMTDADISAVINHVITQGKPAKPARPFKPAEIAEVRAKGQIAGSATAELRKTLVASGVIK